VNICWLKFMLALVEDQDEKTLGGGGGVKTHQHSLCDVIVAEEMG